MSENPFLCAVPTMKPGYGEKMQRTSSNTDFPLGLNVLGPLSNNIFASLPFSSFTSTLSLFTQPPSRFDFSKRVMGTVGSLRARWYVAERPDRPPPRTSIDFGRIDMRILKLWMEHVKDEVSGHKYPAQSSDDKVTKGQAVK